MTHRWDFPLDEHLPGEVATCKRCEMVRTKLEGTRVVTYYDGRTFTDRKIPPCPGAPVENFDA